jgi:hypothetical protein
LGGSVIYVGRLSIVGLGSERPHGPLSRLVRSVRLTEGGNRTDREKFGYLAAETELMTEHFGLGLFGLGLFGSVFGPQSIMPTPSRGVVAATSICHQEAVLRTSPWIHHGYQPTIACACTPAAGGGLHLSPHDRAAARSGREFVVPVTKLQQGEQKHDAKAEPYAND